MKPSCVAGPQLFGRTLRSQKTAFHTGSTGLSCFNALAMLVWPLTQMFGQLRVSNVPTCPLVGTFQWLKHVGTVQVTLFSEAMIWPGPSAVVLTALLVSTFGDQYVR